MTQATNEFPRRLRVAVAVVSLIAAYAPNMLGQSSPCLTAQPTADAFVETLRLRYNDVGADSVQWKAIGFPFATEDAITLVKKRATCNKAVAAYNTQTGRHVAPVYVAQIGSTGYVVMEPSDAAGEWRWYYWFDAHCVIQGCADWVTLTERSHWVRPRRSAETRKALKASPSLTHVHHREIQGHVPRASRLASWAGNRAISISDALGTPSQCTRSLLPGIPSGGQEHGGR